jgi:hypothetical protein
VKKKALSSHRGDGGGGLRGGGEGRGEG